MITPGYEYYYEDNELIRDPNTYLNKTPLEMVTQFAKTYKQSVNLPWMKDTRQDLLRLMLVKEEYAELISATDEENLIKELADLVYVTYGYAATFGWNLDEAVRRVHASNMSKLDEEGEPIFREDGKVLKGPNYREPYLEDLKQ
jgi:NTP pyrophosphatase (non-canonical NTP hydrolase)